MAGDPYFTNVPKSRGDGPQKIVQGASQRIIRAVPGSQGQEVSEERIDYVQKEQYEDWLPDDIDRVSSDTPGSGVATGFGRWMQTEGSFRDQRHFPIENAFRPLDPNEESRLLAGTKNEQRLMSEAEVSRDEVTRIPDNVSWQDPQAESDKFFGSEKRPRELDQVLDRMKEVDRGKEQVDYRRSKAIPIKVLRRR